MPALMRAAKLHKRAQRHGAAVPPASAQELAAAAAALQAAAPGSAGAEQALGRLLECAAALGRAAGVNPEQALQRANDAFVRAAQARKRLRAGPAPCAGVRLWYRNTWRYKQ